MKVDIDKYNIVSRVLLDRNLRLIFQHKDDEEDKKVLHLDHVAGFIDLITDNDDLKVLRVDNPGGAYNFDLSLRLQDQDIKANAEVFMFTDIGCVNFRFRASAKKVDFRDWVENSAKPSPK